MSKGLELEEKDDQGVPARDYLSLVASAASGSAAYWDTPPGQRAPFNPFLSALAMGRDPSRGSSSNEACAAGNPARQPEDELPALTNDVLYLHASTPDQGKSTAAVTGLATAECWSLMWPLLQVHLVHQAAAPPPHVTRASRSRRRLSARARRKEEAARVAYGASIMAAACGVGDVRSRSVLPLCSAQLECVSRCMHRDAYAATRSRMHRATCACTGLGGYRIRRYRICRCRICSQCWPPAVPPLFASAVSHVVLHLCVCACAPHAGVGTNGQRLSARMPFRSRLWGRAGLAAACARRCSPIVAALPPRVHGSPSRPPVSPPPPFRLCVFSSLSLPLVGSLPRPLLMVTRGQGRTVDERQKSSKVLAEARRADTGRGAGAGRVYGPQPPTGTRRWRSRLCNS